MYSDYIFVSTDPIPKFAHPSVQIIILEPFLALLSIEVPTTKAGPKAVLPVYSICPNFSRSLDFVIFTFWDKHFTQSVSPILYKVSNSFNLSPVITQGF